MIAKVLCTTCGIQTETGEEARSMTYNCQTLYFCSEACQELFLAAPADYLGGSREPDSRG